LKQLKEKKRAENFSILQIPMELHCILLSPGGKMSQAFGDSSLR